MTVPSFRSRTQAHLLSIVLLAFSLAACGKGGDGNDGGGDGDGDASNAQANVYGQVVLASGDELDDYERVAISLLDGESEVESTTLDDQGVFEFTDLESGDYTVDVSYEGGLEGAEESAYRPFQARFSVDVSGTINLGRLELDLGVGTVAGSVSFGGGEGVNEATVSLQGNTGAFQKQTQGGEFSFSDVSVGHHSLIVQREGFTACEEPVTVSHHGEEVDAALSLSSKAVTLSPSGDTEVNIEGDTWFLEDSSVSEVSMAVNAPFAAAARAWESDSEIPEFEDFDDEDALTLTGLATGRSSYKFQFRSACGLESEIFQRDFVRDAEPPVVDFVTLNSGIPASQSRTMALSVSARDEVSDALQMRIALCDVNGETVDCSPTLEEAPWEPYQFSRSVTFSDVSGQKRILVQIRDQNANETETYQADVVYDPDPPSDISLAVNEILVGESNIIHDNLPLITIAGEGIAEMRVGLEAGLGAVTWRPYQSAFRFEIPGEDGTYTMYFQFRDEAGNTTSIISVPFVMDRTGGLIGSVQLAGKGSNEHGGAQIALLGTSFLTLTDGDGNFSLDNVPAGRYPLIITKTNYRDHREGIVEIIAADTLDLGTIFLEDFQARVLGNVVLQGFEGTSKHSGVSVRLIANELESDPLVLSDAVGNFALVAPPGNYPDGLVFEKNGYETFVRPGDITLLPDGTFNVGEIFLTATTNVVHGTARRAGEAEHSGIQVRLLAETGSVNEGLELVTTTDATGLYRLEDVPLGPFRLILQDPSDASRETYERGGVDVAPGPILDMGLVELRNRFLNINGSDTVTQSQEVELTLGATDCLEMQVSNSSDFTGAVWAPCESPIPWMLTAGQGQKSVYARFLTGADPVNPTEALTDTIILDSLAGMTSFTHDGGGRLLTQGSVVRFTVYANEPAALVEVAISGYESGIQLFDNGTQGDTTAGDNIYTREFTIARVDDINNAPVTAYFTDHAGNQANASGPTVTIAIDPLIYGVEITTSYAAGTATVEFDTDEPTTAVVEWGLVVDGSPSWTYSEVLGSLATNHSVTFGAGVLIPAETYAVRITAEDAAGNETTTAGSHRFSLLPSVPQRVVAIPGIGRNHVRWEIGSLTSVQGFNIYRSTTPSDPSPTKLNADPYNHEVFLYEDDTVTNGTTYYYSVKSVDLLDNESEVSNESEATPQAASDGPTDVEGVFWGTTVWSEVHSPYIVNGTVSFEEQAENKAFLVVGPGTSIEVAPNEGLSIKGQWAMYGEDSAQPNDAVFYSNDVADTECTGTSGVHLDFGPDTDGDGVLDPEEVDPTRSVDFCNVSIARSYEAPASDCDCEGARCMKWYRSNFNYEHLGDQCLHAEAKMASVVARDFNTSWRDIVVTLSPPAVYDMRNGEYRMGNVLYKSTLAGSSSYVVNSVAGLFVTQSSTRRNGSGIYVNGGSPTTHQNPLVIRDSTISDPGGYQVYGYNSSSLIMNNAFRNGAGLIIQNNTADPLVNMRMFDNTFEGSSSVSVQGHGTFTRNVLENVSVNADYRVGVAENEFVGQGYLTFSGNSSYRSTIVNNHADVSPGRYIACGYTDLYANVVSHDRVGASTLYTMSTNRSRLTGNYFHGDFTAGRLLQSGHESDLYSKNNFMITDANSSGGTGLALWATRPETVANVQALNNYWGEVTTVEMDAGGNPKDVTAIHDHYDDGDLVRVDYDNWAADSFPLPWVVEPMFLSQYETGEDVTFGGYGWDAEDALTASCPAISPTDATRFCPQDGADHCPAACFLNEANLRWCATEADCTGENQLHLGSTFVTTFNSAGIHTVWMRAYDSGGQFVAIPWRVEVVE